MKHEQRKWTYCCCQQEVVREELHAKDVVEFADAVKLDSFRVIDVQPFLLSHGIHALTVEPPAEGRSCCFVYISVDIHRVLRFCGIV